MDKITVRICYDHPGAYGMGFKLPNLKQKDLYSCNDSHTMLKWYVVEISINPRNRVLLFKRFQI